MYEKKIRQDLAFAHRVLSNLKLDDHTYTHLSSRSKNGFYISKFGLLFEEVTEDSLVEVSDDGDTISPNEEYYNQTGYFIHNTIYKHRPDINHIFHVHVPEIVAVSAYKNGLLPLSQWALHFYKKVSYHNYNSLTLGIDLAEMMSKDLGNNYVMFLRNHGSITAGTSIQEAMFYTYHLYQACKTQCLMLSAHEHDYITPHDELCIQSVNDLLNFEKNLGHRDWNAWKRKLSSNSSTVI